MLNACYILLSASLIFAGRLLILGTHSTGGSWVLRCLAQYGNLSIIYKDETQIEMIITVEQTIYLQRQCVM
jgi:hypothetical protein